MLGLPLGAGLSLGLLLRSLTALLLGRLTRLPVIAAAAVALGVLELGVDWNQNSELPLLGIQCPPVDAVLAAVILVSMLVRRREGGRTGVEEQSRWRESGRAACREGVGRDG